MSEGENLACKEALHSLLQGTTEAEGQREVDYRKGNWPLKSEYTSMCQSMHRRAHLYQYMLTLHTYLLHISFHKEFLIKTGSCFLWNLVLHHTLLKLLKKKRKQGCYSSSSSKHLLASLLETATEPCASLALMMSESFTILCLHITFVCTRPLTLPPL